MRLSGAPRRTLNSVVAEQDESDLDSASICAAVLALTGWVYSYFTDCVLYSEW